MYSNTPIYIDITFILHLLCLQKIWCWLLLNSAASTNLYSMLVYSIAMLFVWGGGVQRSETLIHVLFRNCKNLWWYSLLWWRRRFLFFSTRYVFLRCCLNRDGGSKFLDYYIRAWHFRCRKWRSNGRRRETEGLRVCWQRMLHRSTRTNMLNNTFIQRLSKSNLMRLQCSEEEGRMGESWQ
jgi:hypothetical protein